MKANLYLWTKIKKINIDFFMKVELYQIIDKYIEQVQFVTGIVQDECNLFLAERNSNFENKTYLCDMTEAGGGKEKNFIRMMRKIKAHLELGKMLYIIIGFKCENENQLVYFPEWYKENCLTEQKIESSKIDYAFNNIIYVLEQENKNKKINQLLSKEGTLTKDEKLMLVSLSNVNKEKTLV